MRILLVDDNDDDIMLTELALRECDAVLKLDVVRSGSTAVEILGDPGKSTPYAVLLDIRLPGLDGLEVLRLSRAQEHLRNVPIVMLSSSTQPEEMARSYVLGANSYVIKPVSFEAYRRHLRGLVGYLIRGGFRPGGAA